MALSADILFMTLLYFLFISEVSAFADQQEIKVKSGEDVTLQCRGPADASIILLEWNRPDLSMESYIFFYRNKRSYENYQLPSFHGRVKLSDPEMKNGDTSVVLKNVTVNDTGTYECRITIRTSELNEIKHLIGLTVTDSDDTAENKDGGNRDGYVAVICASTVISIALAVAIICIGVMIYRKRSNTHKKRVNNHDVVI